MAKSQRRVIMDKLSSSDYRFTALQLLSLIKWFSIQVSIIHDNISSQVANNRKEKIVLGQRMNSSILHDNICSFIHEKRHPKKLS